jgi:hypothetical protein
MRDAFDDAIMKSRLLVAIGLVVTSTTAASADGYLGLGVGTPPGVNDAMESFSPPSGRSLRGIAGIRFGNVSLEGALNGFGVVFKNQNRTVYQLSGALKLSLPLGSGFEAFGRAGIERTWLNLDDPRNDLMGDGFLVGAGFEYRLNAIVSNASIFVDYNIHHASLAAQDGMLDTTTRILGLGFTVGI